MACKLSLRGSERLCVLFRHQLGGSSSRTNLARHADAKTLARAAYFIRWQGEYFLGPALNPHQSLCKNVTSLDLNWFYIQDALCSSRDVTFSQTDISGPFHQDTKEA